MSVRAALVALGLDWLDVHAMRADLLAAIERANRELMEHL